MRIRRWLPVVAGVTAVAAVGCTQQRPGDGATSPSGPDVEADVAADVAVDIVANGRRLVVRNHRAQGIVVLDTAMEPEREERSGVLTLTYARPDTGDSGDEPAIFEAVPVAAHGRSWIDPPHVVSTGDRLRYCLEVVDPSSAIGGDETRVPNRDPGEPMVLACSRPVTVR